MDTPILDGVLGDRLQQARAAVERAEAGSRAFTAALTAGQARALEHLAVTRAERLVGARTALLSARVSALETEVRTLQDQAVRAAAAAHAEASAAAGADAVTHVGVEVEVGVGVGVDEQHHAAAQPDAQPAHAQPADAQPADAQPADVQPADAQPAHADPGGATPPAEVVSTTAAQPPAPLPPAPPTVPAAAVAARPARKGADQGPTGEDVPTVPSMKEIFASSRAAGWLDSLLGARR